MSKKYEKLVKNGNYHSMKGVIEIVFKVSEFRLLFFGGVPFLKPHKIIATHEVIRKFVNFRSAESISAVMAEKGKLNKMVHFKSKYFYKFI